MPEELPTWAEASEQLSAALGDLEQLSITVKGRGGIPITLNYPVSEFHRGTAELAQSTRPQLERLQLTALDPPFARPTICRYTDLTLTLKIRPAHEPPLGPDVTDQEGPL